VVDAHHYFRWISTWRWRPSWISLKDLFSRKHRSYTGQSFVLCRCTGVFRRRVCTSEMLSIVCSKCVVRYPRCYRPIRQHSPLNLNLKYLTTSAVYVLGRAGNGSTVAMVDGPSVSFVDGSCGAWFSARWPISHALKYTSKTGKREQIEQFKLKVVLFAVFCRSFCNTVHHRVSMWTLWDT